MSLRSLLACLLLAAGLFGLGWLVLATRDLAAAVGRREVAARQLQQDLGRTRDDLVAEHARAAALQARADDLERQLQQALGQQHRIGDLLAQRAEQEEQQRQSQQAARLAADAPMPEGVRLALLALRDCLRADGFHGLRFLAARDLGEQQLRGVELVDADPERMTSTLYVAGRMTVHLDRERQQVTFRFFDGQRRRDGTVEAFPAEGLAVPFAPVTGAMWEQKLPYLLQAEGTYAEPAAAAPARHGLDAATRGLWLDRLNALLAKARNEPRLVVGDLRDLQDGRFRGVTVNGYDRGNLLQLAASADSLAVEVDARAGTVQLLLCDGVLQQKGGESSIGKDGFRMLLRDLTPQQAADVMLGMVVRR